MNPRHRFPFWLVAALGLLVSPPARSAEDATNAPPPTTPLGLFNAGTRRLQAGKLAAAEEMLQASVAGQDARLQSPALYNLGCVRVAEGVELLKQEKEAGAQSNPTVADQLTDEAGDASRRIDDAIASASEQQMIAAYLHGGGIHREINAATKAVRKALESRRQTLAKWQRAAGDFRIGANEVAIGLTMPRTAIELCRQRLATPYLSRAMVNAEIFDPEGAAAAGYLDRVVPADVRSAAELNDRDADALYNAGATERAIAALIDKLNQLQQAGLRMNAAGHQLGDKLKQLKGMIPAPNMPPGAPGDENDDEDMAGIKPGQKEAAGKTGDDNKLSPEEAQQLLNGYKLAGDHPLKLTDEANNKPKNQSGKNW